MMRKLFLLVVMVWTAGLVQAGTKSKASTPKESDATYRNDFPAYVIYDRQGNRVTYSQMVQALSEADVCLFGEQHNDPISHWLELSLVKSFHALKGDRLVVGAEMWETDNQLLMDEMLIQKLVDGSSYTESSKLWPNFTTDYKPILQYVKSQGLPFVCTNIPRRYARLVYKKGIEYLDSLSAQAKSYLPPLPVHFDLTQPVYAKMASVFPTDEEFERQQREGKALHGPMQGSKPSNLVKAQAIKDATMAYFILQHLTPGQFFFHFNGEFHSANHTSICYYLDYYRPGVRYKTVSVCRTKDCMHFDPETDNRADFNILIPDDMAVTYIASPF